MRVDHEIRISSDDIKVEVNQGGREITKGSSDLVGFNYTLKINVLTDKELTHYEMKRIAERVQLDFSYFEESIRPEEIDSGKRHLCKCAHVIDRYNSIGDQNERCGMCGKKLEWSDEDE